MAVLEPAAIRCGLLPKETWTMTVGEIIAVITERGKEREDNRRFLDSLNGQSCAIAVSSHVPNANVRPLDYMITKIKGALHRG